MRFVASFLIACICSACGDNAEICASPSTLKSLKYNFSYELLADKDLPQITFSDFNRSEATNSFIWCTAKGHITGNAKAIGQVLEAKMGHKNWQLHKKQITKMDLNKIALSELKKYSDPLALYFVTLKSNEIPSDYTFKIDLDMAYAINRYSDKVVNVDYQENIYKEVLAQFYNTGIYSKDKRNSELVVTIKKIP